MKPVGWLALGVLLVVVGIEEFRLQGMRARIRELEARPEPVEVPSAGGAGARATDRTAATSPRRERSARPTADGEEPEGGAGMGGTLRKMAENPVSRAMMNQGVKAMTSVWYADLIEQFALSEEEGDYFLSLKASMLADQQQFGIRMMGAKDAAERQAIVDEMNQSKEDHREAVRTFLNHDEDFATYEAFEDRLPERQQLDGLRTSLAGAGAPLREDQEAGLVEAMYRARQEQPQATDWNGTGGLEAIADGNARARFESEWEQSSRRVAGEVGGVLDDAQMEAFRTYQQQLKEMQLMGLEMAEKMFRADPAEGAE